MRFCDIKRSSIIVTLIALGMVQSVCFAQQSHSDSSLVRFIAGVTLLQGTTTLSEEKKAKKYQELVKITGVNADTAIKYLSESRQNLQESKLLFDLIKKECLAIQSSQLTQSQKR